MIVLPVVVLPHQDSPTKEKPSLRKLEEDHYVLCNSDEYEKYVKRLKK